MAELQRELREADLARYLSVLYAPEARRDDLTSLYLFDAQIDRIRQFVSEPLPGEVRLQWWRDVILGQRAAEAASHPLAAALLASIERNGLATGAFDQLLEARIFDLYDDPMHSKSDFEGYCGETRSLIVQMAAQILAQDPTLAVPDAAGHAGVALGTAQCLAELALHRRRGQVFIPGDLLAAVGGDARVLIEGSDADFVERAVSAFVAFGSEHLDKARTEIAKVPDVCKPAFLPLVASEMVFSKALTWKARVATESLQISTIGLHWKMLTRALKS